MEVRLVPPFPTTGLKVQLHATQRCLVKLNFDNGRSIQHDDLVEVLETGDDGQLTQVQSFCSLSELSPGRAVRMLHACMSKEKELRLLLTLSPKTSSLTRSKNGAYHLI
ncbi:MAG: hypothetical protein K2X93_25020 [Candidatus Obscuribacterales bacterium]|nr:hypothetical protein [Candidatus Obscuribacterales bacterium]